MGLTKTLKCIKKCFDIEPITLWIVGFAILFFGFFIFIRYSSQWGTIIISFAIAFFAVALSRKSERMTRDIAFSSFYDSLNTMRERRLSLRDKLYNIEFKINNQDTNYTTTLEGSVDVEDYIRYFSYTIWLSNVYLDRAMLFKKYIGEKERDFLIGFIDNLVMS